ncbi:cache domain-containing sensor histidine kinase [Paenibacillus agricola]|uniref:Histidine kinase n=1 Tax=Paenibacillus agricola TaxID=2716264 RepID=A0ABX0J256_9BACL|nr:sensor histidine kinase [Paenibacillus agricola]NHN29209.1 histidine kinase [Paenibacillus agricola]
MPSSSIRNKLIVFLLAATIIPISTSIIITYLFTKQTVSNEAVLSNSNLIRQANKNLLNYLKVIEQSSLSVYNDNTFYTIIENGDTDYLSNNEITRGLQTIANSVKEIRQTYLYMSESKRSLLISERNPVPGNGSQPQYQPATKGAEVYLEPTHLSHDYGMGRLFYAPPSTVITLHRSIRNSLTQKELGTVSIDFGLEVIRSICEELYTRGEEELYILDEKGTVIYGANPDLLGKVLDEQWVRHLTTLPHQYGSFESNSKQFAGVHIYERLSAPYMNWTMVKQIPYDSLYRNAREITLINALIFSLFLIVVISATLYISFRFTAPIRNLLGYISKIQTGDMQVDIQVTSNDEIGVLARRFRLMMQTINNLIMSEYKLDIANKTNQLKALQAQINPHFLYNSLQSIGTLALQHEVPKIYQLLSALAKMMRYSMNTNESRVELLQELNHVKAYLQLQLQRFENELAVRYDIEESALSLEIPKMLLQPLVENYFKHGFDHRNPSNLLIVSCRWAPDGQNAILVIEDNGIGMPQARFEALLQQLEQQLEQQADLFDKDRDKDPELESHIGLYNVKNRLLLYFNGNADLQIERVVPSGFRVTLRVPIVKSSK